MPVVSIQPKDISVTVNSGVTLMDALHAAGLTPDAPCGGRGTCGKCKVLVTEGPITGEVRSCQTIVTEDMTVRLFEKADNKILSAAAGTVAIETPILRAVKAKVERCVLGEASSDCQRVKAVLGEGITIPLPVASRLYEDLEAADYEPTFLLWEDTLVAVRSGEGPVLSLAIDIGTTTIVCYLMDAVTGRQIAVASCLNPQTAYGADVISRCNYDMTDPDKTMSRLVREALNTLAGRCAADAGLSVKDVCYAAIVGNTAMQHLLLGVSPTALVKAPYNATVDEMQILPARELGFSLAPGAQVCVFPSIAGFVGGDTVGVILSLPEETFDKLTLVLDIGTNGELVLGKGDNLYTCSTAAGPAFEGAKITFGMRGATGAIDHVTVTEEGLLDIHVIGDVAPKGICGSGLIDLISSLLALDILDVSGRMNPVAEWSKAAREAYANRVVKKNNIQVFLLTDDPEGVYLSQMDVRELQLAKGAICAGVEILAQEMGIDETTIEQVLLAGAFGTFLNADSACNIGLIPAELKGRIRAIGNAAGEGAKLASVDRNMRKKAMEIARKPKFVELAVNEDFQDIYFSRLSFSYGEED